MQSLLRMLLLVGLVALVSASPRPIQKRGVYKVERIPNPGFTGHNGPRALLKTLRKYRMPIPGGLVEAAAKSDIEMISRRDLLDDILGALEGGKKNKNNGGGVGGGAGAAATASGAAVAKASKAAVSKAPKSKAPKASAAPKVSAAPKAGAGAGAGAGAAKNGTGAGAGTGLVTATPEKNDVEYLSPVNIGGQTLNLDFDSGSSDLWVFSSALSTAATTGHTVFDETKSPSFKPLTGASFSISYGDGSGAAGLVGTDTVNLGGATVTAQAVELATAVSKSFVQDTSNNGLLGLAFSSLNTVKPTAQKTFFDNVMPSLAEPVFTADLRKQAVGAYEFGRIDASKFTGAMAWVPVNASAGFWQFTSESFAVNGGAVQTSTKGGQAIADTGTTLILADPKVAQAYYATVPNAVNDAQQGGFVFPCDTKMPDLALDVGGTMATVKGSDINFSPIDAAGNCFGGLQASPAGLSIYGDIFFKSNFVAFNGGNMSLGVATHA